MGTMLGNHVWQSTLFAAAIWMGVWLARRHHAAVRHALWLAASLKFAVPFAVLVWAGHQIEWPGRPSVVYLERASPLVVLSSMGEPFSQGTVRLSRAGTATPASPAWNWRDVLAGVWLLGTACLLTRWGRQWWQVRCVLRHASWGLATEREVAQLRALEARRRRGRPLRVAFTEDALEPGVFGIARPVLVWPRRLSRELSDSQIDAVLLHELTHVARRDNLAAAVHAVVEAVFWWHPMVWWIGARLVDERERACDERVLGDGSERDSYAESLIATCRVSLEAPACVAGVTGASLARRIERIMTEDAGVPLDRWRRLVVASVAAGAVLVPVLVGLLSAPRLLARSLLVIQDSAEHLEFEVASVKPNVSGDGPVRIELQANSRFLATNFPLRGLIRFAYAAQDYQLVDVPEWAARERFDIVAKAPGELPLEAPGTIGKPQLLTQSLLRDRFQLRVHRETREMPVYALTLARRDGKLGASIAPSTVDCEALMRAPRDGGLPPPRPNPGARPQCGLRTVPGRIMAGGFPLSQLALTLSQRMQRIVIDRTELTGNFDFEVKFTPDPMPTSAPDGFDLSTIDPNGPSLTTALQEQLGLKLEPMRAPVDVLVVDRVERPSPD